METKGLLTALIRLLAVYTFALSAAQFPATNATIVQTFRHAGMGLSEGVAYVATVVVSLFLLPLLIWFLAPPLAAQISRSHHSISLNLSVLDVLKLGIVFIGLSTLPGGLAQLGATVYSLTARPDGLSASQLFEYDHALRLTFLSAAIRSALAIILIVFPHRLSGIIARHGS